MKTYDWAAVDGRGALTTGRDVAVGELALDRELEARGLVLTELEEVSSERRARRLRIRRDELILITTQLATMTSSGVRIVEALEGIRRRIGSADAQALCGELVVALRAGQPLSEALDLHPGTFPEVYRASIRAGEASGALDIVLNRLAKHLEWSRTMRATTIHALIYPCMLVFALTVLILVLLNFVIPRIVTMFPGGRADLPLETRAVLAVSDFLSGNALWLGIGLLCASVGLALALKHPRGRERLGAVALRLPKFGKLLRQLATSRFAATCSTLHQAGCEVFGMLSIAGATCGNASLARAFGRSAEGIRRGLTITQALEREPQVDSLLVQMVAVGEETGTLDTSLSKLVEYYDEEIPRIVKQFLALFEPVMLMVAGVVVGGILLAALMPIFSLYENL